MTEMPFELRIISLELSLRVVTLKMHMDPLEWGETEKVKIKGGTIKQPLQLSWDVL